LFWRGANVKSLALTDDPHNVDDLGAQSARTDGDAVELLQDASSTADEVVRTTLRGSDEG
jgi:hypothetical protein